MALESSEIPTYGIALSGGGHRERTFARALLYLCDVGCNRHVRVVASVSGGSLLNGFVASIGVPFSEMTGDEFERHASRLAATTAGRPRWWFAAALSSVLYSLLCLLLALAILDTWIALPRCVCRMAY